MKKGQAVFAGVLVVISGGLLAGLAYLTVALPRTMAVWAHETRELTGLEILVANASGFCTRFRFAIFLLLILVFAGSVTWMVKASRKMEWDGDPDEGPR